MPESLQEFISSRGLALRIDREAGIIRGVKILGLESQNGRSYLPEALTAAVPLYEGAKVNVNHPKALPGTPRDYQDRIGAIHGVAVRANEGLFADLHFNPQHALAGQLAWDAEHAPENVGFSHNVLAKTARRGDRVVVENITKVQSVDLVADPATTRGLFEAAGRADALARNEPRTTGELLWEEMTAAELERRRPDLVEALVGEVRRENALLRLQVDEARAADAVLEKRTLALRLLEEAHLPSPHSDAGWAKEIVSQAFYESLLAAPDEGAMRRLVHERVQLVSAAAGFASHRPTAWHGRPLARDQQLVEAGWPTVIDAAAFARSIT
ncbi:MAG TPA: hypothetical protein VGG64_01925 [Pirellulales bacterium]|jgi:hypothetical protein